MKNNRKKEKTCRGKDPSYACGWAKNHVDINLF
jgi:hypothetical protein